MIFLAEKKLGQSLPEPLDVEVALEHTRVTNRNLAAFLGNDEGDGVRLFGKTESGAVAETDCPVKVLPLRQGEDTPCGLDAVPAQDHAPVMEHGLGVKDGQEEFLGKSRIQLHAALRHRLQADVALQRNEGSEALAGKVENRVRDLLDFLPASQGRGEEPVASEFVQGAPQFRLEDHHERNSEEDGEAPQKPAKHGKIQNLGNQREGQKDQRKSDQDPGAVGAAQVEIDVVEDRREDQDLESRGPVAEKSLPDHRQE